MPPKKKSDLRAFGWVRDLPDHRDYLYSAPGPVLAALPSKVDLRLSCPAVYDQGALGSCTANALGAAYAFCLKKQKAQVFAPSRLFIYYNERAMEGTVNSDGGAQIRDGIKTLNAQGVCPEPQWPYVAARFATRPSAKAYQVALDHQALSYQRVLQSLPQLKGCLAAGFPIVLGFSVYESFQTPAVAQSGTGPMPRPTERRIGGHAVLAVGYDEGKRVFLLRNSWGTKWGQKGYFTLPYAYLQDAGLAADMWTVKIVEG